MAEQTKEMELNFTFGVTTINAILAALDEMPHKMSRRIIDDIQKQAQAQVAQKPEGPLSDKVVS